MSRSSGGPTSSPLVIGKNDITPDEAADACSRNGMDGIAAADGPRGGVMSIPYPPRWIGPAEGVAMRRRHGFTLVELLVAIGIITVPISILLPMLNRARERAAGGVCRQPASDLLGGSRYANQNQSWLPPRTNVAAMETWIAVQSLSE